MSDYSMADIGSLLGASSNITAENSTSRKNNTELDMTDFLQLMIVQLQSQTLDDTMDTSEMMNQLVQMQMVTALTNMTETNLMTYASSLVGKVVTVGIYDGNSLEEREIRVMGTGTYNGEQVIFGHDGKMYQLKQIMAVGYLPNEDGSYGPGAIGGTGDSTQTPGDTTTPPEGAGGAGNTTQTPDGTTPPEGSTGDSGTDTPPASTDPVE